MQLRFRLGAITLGLLVFGACKEQSTEISRGSQGESCTRRDDCMQGFACIENRCSADGQGAPLDGGVTPSASGGTLGESCTRRADCQSGLACFNQVCSAENALPQGDAGVTELRGDRGETCAARNDCRPGLACVMGRCRENEFGLTVQAKECFRVQCAEDVDCCENFVEPTSCPIWMAECADGGSVIACNNYEALCKCPFTCKDSLCLVEDTCSSDLDCSSGLPHCVDEHCVQCETTADCLDDEAQCVDGVCRSACERNEQCPLFYACMAGKCEDVGCSSDRECYFSTREPRSKCVDAECVTPCDNDAECTQPFNVCEQGRCVFVGCESDEECRVLLNLQNQVGSDTAVCRMPEET